MSVFCICLLVFLFICYRKLTRSSSTDEIANVNFFNDVHIRVQQNTIDSRINSVTGQRSTSRPEAEHQNKEATVKRNLNDKLKESNDKILAFSYVRKLHRSMCYRRRLLINKFNAQ